MPTERRLNDAGRACANAVAAADTDTEKPRLVDCTRRTHWPRCGPMGETRCRGQCCAGTDAKHSSPGDRQTPSLWRRTFAGSPADAPGQGGEHVLKGSQWADTAAPDVRPHEAQRQEGQQGDDGWPGGECERAGEDRQRVQPQQHRIAQARARQGQQHDPSSDREPLRWLSTASPAHAAYAVGAESQRTNPPAEPAGSPEGDEPHGQPEDRYDVEGAGCQDRACGNERAHRWNHDRPARLSGCQEHDDGGNQADAANDPPNATVSCVLRRVGGPVGFCGTAHPR